MTLFRSDQSWRTCQLSTLELALNDRYGAKIKKHGKYRSFADLLKFMLVDGLTDDKIPMVQKYGGSVIGYISGDGEPGLTERRNTMAHGDSFDGFPVGDCSNWYVI